MKYFLVAMAALWILSIAFVVYVAAIAIFSSWLSHADDKPDAEEPCDH